jgi:hypothetical protein
MTNEVLRRTPDLLKSISSELRKLSKKDRQSLYGPFEEVPGAASVYTEAKSVVNAFGKPQQILTDKALEETQLVTPPVFYKKLQGNIWLTKYCKHSYIDIVFKKNEQEPEILFHIFPHATHQFKGNSEIPFENTKQYKIMMKLFEWYTVSRRKNERATRI